MNKADRNTLFKKLINVEKTGVDFVPKNSQSKCSDNLEIVRSESEMPEAATGGVL